ncbi:MAG: hypothetical protein R3285_07410 [Kiloniellales bacterium]|nr:hypothetical protein [Kiloniellales bacterium]
MRWLVRKVYPKETFTDRRAALLADLALLAAAVVAVFVLAASLI